MTVVVHEEKTTVSVGIPGLQGPQGPAGPGGGGAAVVHTQSSASTSWSIAHTLGREPNVVVVIGGDAVSADVSHPTTSLVVINFGSAQTGKAILT